MSAASRLHVRIHKGYLLSSIALLAILILIALFVRDSFVRPFLGDVLAVLWVHLCIRAVLNVRHTIAACVALGIAFTLECAQYFALLDVLGLRGFPPARIILGATFDPLDLLAYALGFILILAIERGIVRRQTRTTARRGAPKEAAEK